MREKVYPEKMPDEPEDEDRGPQSIIDDYIEVKDLVAWLIVEGPTAAPALKSEMYSRLNTLFARNNLTTEYMQNSAAILQQRAQKALARLGLKSGN